MNSGARIIKNFIEFQRNVSTEKAIHSLEELKRFVMWDNVLFEFRREVKEL